MAACRRIPQKNRRREPILRLPVFSSIYQGNKYPGNDCPGNEYPGNEYPEIIHPGNEYPAADAGFNAKPAARNDFVRRFLFYSLE